MRVMNMLLDVAGINLEANVTPGDREILKKLEAEAEDQERKKKPTTMEHVVFGRKVQLLGRAVICLALIFAVQIVKGAGSFWETLVAWSVAEALWCGVREFYRGTDFALHELAVICGTLLLVLMRSQWMALYAFGISQMLAVILSNQFGRKLDYGKRFCYYENIAKLFFLFCGIMAVVMY